MHRSSRTQVLVSVVLACVVGCADGNSQPGSYGVSGNVEGLAGAGLTLVSDAAGQLEVARDGTFTMPKLVAVGAQWKVAVARQPTAPWQTCTIQNDAGVMASGGATIGVTCVTNRYHLGAAVVGLAGSGLVLQDDAGEQLEVPSDGSFTFAATPPSGATFHVSVARRPQDPPQTCAVEGGEGTISNSDVSARVTCTTDAYAIGGTISAGSVDGLVLLNAATGEELAVQAGSTTFRFSKLLLPGRSYEVRIASGPGAPVNCAIANASGTVRYSSVEDVAVSCTSAVHAWTAPRSWGETWQETSSMMQHASFDAARILTSGLAFDFVGGTPPAPVAMGGFPGGVRYAAGPFPTEAVNYRSVNASPLGLQGDLLACAVVKPGRSRPFDSFEAPIISSSIGDGKNSLPGAGWSLMQMHDSWCFHYQFRDGAGVTHWTMVNIPAHFANQDFHGVMTPPVPWPSGLGQPNASYDVVCGGRSGDDIFIAVNGFDVATGVSGRMALGASGAPAPYVLDLRADFPASIGGYHLTSPQFSALYPGAFSPSPGQYGWHGYDGLIYETGVWSEPATAQNINARMRSMLGLAPGTTYLRNRDGAYVGGDGALHFAGRHAPRVDPARGYLFGLQGWNRVSYWVPGSAAYEYTMVFAAGENFTLWDKAAGDGGAPTVVVDAAVTPPGDSRNAGQKITLPAGASLSIELDKRVPPPVAGPDPTPSPRTRPTWEATGPILGQLWIRPASAGTLRVQKTEPAPGMGSACVVLGGPATCEQKDVALDALQQGLWSRVSLNGAFTADAATQDGLTVHRGTLVLTNPGPDTIRFHLWGVQLTQLPGGGDLGGFDPAELMYDWSASKARDAEPTDDPTYPIDVLRLDPVPQSTATSGFCVAAEATMPAGLRWNVAPGRSRTVMAAKSASGVTLTQLQVRGSGPDAGRLCADVAGAPSLCATLPAGIDDERPHAFAACMSADGNLRIYGDPATPPLAQRATGVRPPDLAGATVLIGNGEARAVDALSPWHGYVSRALVCRDTGDARDCR